MSPVYVPSQFGFSRSFINQPRLGVNHKTMIVKIKTTGLKGKPENITTQILSREERGVAGQGSLRAERTTGTGEKKSPLHFGNDGGGKNHSDPLESTSLFYK